MSYSGFAQSGSQQHRQPAPHGRDLAGQAVELFAHVGSKEELQLATLTFARNVFIDHVITPALRSPAGLSRLWTLCDARLSYMSQPVFPGGCFFSSMAMEFDSRPGRVRDSVVAAERDLLRLYETCIDAAIEQGEFPADTDTRQPAFELDALARTAGANALLFEDPTAFGLSRKAILDRLRRLPPIRQVFRRCRRSRSCASHQQASGASPTAGC